jgi:hypothetical protein
MPAPIVNLSEYRMARLLHVSVDRLRVYTAIVAAAETYAEFRDAERVIASAPEPLRRGLYVQLAHRRLHLAMNKEQSK